MARGLGFSKAGYQKDISLNEIGLCAQSMITILGSVVNIIWGIYRAFNEHENLHCDNE